jgi:hypothetical protein
MVFQINAYTGDSLEVPESLTFDSIVDLSDVEVAELEGLNRGDMYQLKTCIYEYWYKFVNSDEKITKFYMRITLL